MLRYCIGTIWGSIWFPLVVVMTSRLVAVSELKLIIIILLRNNFMRPVFDSSVRWKL